MPGIIKDSCQMSAAHKRHASHCTILCLLLAFHLIVVAAEAWRCSKLAKGSLSELGLLNKNLCIFLCCPLCCPLKEVEPLELQGAGDC